MNVIHRLAAVFGLATLVVCPAVALAQLSGPGYPPPGGVALSVPGCGGGDCGTAWATYQNATLTGGMSYTNFDFVQNGAIYWAPPGVGAPVAVTYDAGASGGGRIVWDAVAAYKGICTGIPATCSNPSLEVRVVLTATGPSISAPALLVSRASLGLSGAGALVKVIPGGFHVFYDFGERLAGTTNAFTTGYVYGDGSLQTMNPAYNSGFSIPGQFYWAPPAPPTIAKAFPVSTIPLNSSTTVTYTIGDPNPYSPLQALAFTDNLPAGLTVSATPNVTNTCGGTVSASGSAVSLSGGLISPTSTCTVTVSLTGTAPGPQTSAAGVSSSNGGAGNTSMATIDVLAPPAVTKTFNPAQVPVGVPSTISFAIGNANDVTIDANFADALPAGLVFAAVPNVTNTCGGTATADSPTQTLNFSSATVPRGPCTVTVDVTSGSAGVYHNSVLIHSTAGGDGNTSSADLTVCTYSLSSSGVAAPAAGMSGSFHVTAACSWTATSDSASWLTTSSAGTGNGNVDYTVAANPLTTSRSGNITVGDQTFKVTQAGVLPTNLVATATSPSSVALTWASDPVDHFEIWRDSGAGYVSIGTSTATSYTDNTATANNAYIYEVRAVDSSANASGFSNKDLATTFVFTDDPLAVDTTLVKAVHIMELRQAVNSLSVLAGLGTTTFTDSTLTDVDVKPVHVTELRSALDSARSALGLPALTYTNTLTTGTSAVSAVDVQELRDGVK